MIMDQDEQQFETTDAEASHTYPIDATKIRKGGELMVKGRPCKVLSVKDITNGKHGAAKHHVVATDLFSGAKCEGIVTGHKAPAPFVMKKELQVTYISGDGYVSCLDLKTCATRADLKLPELLLPEPFGAKDLSERIRRFADEEIDFCVIVLKACGLEQIVDTKLMPAPAG